ncbi:helix-turn-helix transcriptional regulator [Gryllotalpicola koreensis]|uniref:helix-turn-helix domain-containing protein n=1 Tax=Gryllotalpicola koreensis TaxID=993086 RepID=UPI0031D1D5EB
MTTTGGPTFTLGELMRKARLDAGLDQLDIARALGIARTSVSNYETNRSEPPASVFVHWAQVTGVPLEWLAGAVNDATPAGTGAADGVRLKGLEPPTF